MNEPIPEAVEAAEKLSEAGFTAALPFETRCAIISSACQEYAKRTRFDIAENRSLLNENNQLQQQLAETQAISAVANKTYGGALERLAELQQDKSLDAAYIQTVQQQRDEAEQALRLIEILCTGQDPSEGEGMPPEEIRQSVELLKARAEKAESFDQLSTLRSDVKPLLEFLDDDGCQRAFDLRKAFLLAHPEFKES